MTLITVEFKKHYEILPNLNIKMSKLKKGGKKVSKIFFMVLIILQKLIKFFNKQIENIKKREIFEKKNLIFGYTGNLGSNLFFLEKKYVFICFQIKIKNL